MTFELVDAVKQFATIGIFGPFIAVWIAMVVAAVWRAYWA